MIQPAKLINGNAHVELLKVENQLLKTQLQRETEAKDLLNVQLQTCMNQVKSLEFQLASALSHQQKVNNQLLTSSKSFTFGTTFQTTQEQTLPSVASFSSVGLGLNRKRPACGIGFDNTDAIGQFKRSRSFANAKQQLHNQSVFSLKSVDSASSFSSGANFAALANTASTLLPEYLRNLQMQATLNLKTRTSCLRCEKKGMKCIFEGRGKVCLECKKSKKKCVKIQVRCCP